MSGPAEIVLRFLDAWGVSRAALHQSIRTFFSADTIWENVGLSTTRGPDEAIAAMERFRARYGAETIAMETLHIAAAGNVVLTERIDRMIDAEGRELFAPRVMGVFEVDGDRIMAWRDYFDTAGMAAL